MARHKSLRTRVTKDYIEELRIRSIYGYINGVISRRRMERMLALMDAFEREAFLPERELLKEMNEEAAVDGKPLTRQSRRAMMRVLAGNPQIGRRRKS